jgi:4-hydroxybenzoate polyprenyltransferase
MFLGLINSLRIHQWVKNSFVLAPLVFSQNLGVLSYVLAAIAAAFLFSLASSSIYLINDLVDREQDRLHPTKKFRPIASGQLSLKAACIASVILILIAGSGACFLSVKFLYVLLGYILLNLCYSFFTKRIVFVDVSTIAIGFVLRVLGGAFVINVEISSWLIICTFLLALFLGLGKRKHELVSLKSSTEVREVLGRYRLKFVHRAMWVVALATLASYTAYTLDSRTVMEFETERLCFTTPFIMFGLWRFHVLSARPLMNSPTELMLKDLLFILNVLLWGGVTLGIIYG